MNKQRITEIISSKENLNYNSDYPLVKELIDSFPYFSTPYVILSKMLFDENSIYFDKNLKVSAAYIGNREILYNYLHEKREKIETYAKTVIEAPVAYAEKTQLDSKEESLSEKTNLKDPAQTIENSEEGELLQVESQDTETNSLEPNEVKPSKVFEEPSENKHPENIDQPPPSAEYNLPEENEFAPTAKNINHFHDFGNEILQYPITDYFSQLFKKEQKFIEEKEIIANEKVDPLAGKKSFSDWLDLLEHQGKTAYKEHALPKPESKHVDHSSVNDLINKFIQTEPKIKPQQSRMYKPEDMAKLSVMEDHNLATETLANIYMKQGLKSRAVEIFQQLILKYPEKSDYFAGKIKDIQTEGSY